MKKVLIAAAVLASTTAPAHAAEEASKFGGAKVGAVIGYDKVRLEVDGDSGSKDGVLYGLTAGYDFDLGKAVIGLEGEVADASTKDSERDVVNFGDELSLHAGRDLYIGARAGFEVSRDLLLYAKAGYTNARFKLKYDGGVNSFSGSDNLDGYRVGAGAEFDGDGFFTRVEYRYSDYGNYEFRGINTGIKTSRHQVAVTGGVRF